MDILTFLKLVVPAVGHRYVAKLVTFDVDGKPRKGFWHYTCSSHTAMANRAMSMDKDGDVVYFALAGYADPVQRVRKGVPQVSPQGKPIMAKRTAELAKAAQAFWADLDCDPENPNKYPDKSAAIASIGQFVKASGAPMPLIVDSGGGLHCYWPLTKPIAAAQWELLAPRWRAALRTYGVKSDPARDMDIASVLRPVQTHNRKYGTEVTVRVLNKNPVQPTSPADFARWLANYKPVVTVKTGGISGPSRLDDLDGAAKQPSYAEEIINHCAQLREFRDSGGDSSEPVWRGMLGLLKHTEGGEEIAHQWSSGFPHYDEDETQEKMDRWETGPTTCAYFMSHEPERCEGCVFAQRQSSPIHLGYRAPTEDTPVPPAAPAPVPAAPAPPQPAVFNVPRPFGVSPTGGLTAPFKNDAGITQVEEFCSSLWFPVARVRTAEGTYQYKFEVRKPDGSVREFELPTSTIYSSKLVETLASYEVFMSHKQGADAFAKLYARAVCNMIASKATEVETYEAFGWHSNQTEFVIGDRCYDSHGQVKTIILGGNAKARAEGFLYITGKAEDWSSAINQLYDRPGAEPYQYAVCSAFGSILGQLHPEEAYRGIPVALTDERSGRGKTTVCLAGLRAFGDPRYMTINTEKGATDMARTTIMATHGSIPLLIDELTNISAEELSPLLYAASNGQDRARLDRNAQLKTQAGWNLSLYVTANTNLSTLLALNAGNVEAESVRLFEISTAQYPIPMVGLSEVNEARNKLATTAGAAGDKFLRALMKNVGAMPGIMEKLHRELRLAVPELETASFRFYRAHAECTLAAAYLLKRLGLVAFDMNLLKAWTISHLRTLCEQVQEHSNHDANDALHRMILHFSNRIIATVGFRRAKQGLEEPMRNVMGTPAGRRTFDDSKTPVFFRNKLFLNQQDVKQWCANHRVNMNRMIQEAREKGIILDIPNGPFQYLGQGTTITTGKVRCICIDMQQISGDISGVLGAVADSDDAEAQS